MKALKQFWREEEGLTMAEYAIVAAVVAVVAIAGFKVLGGAINTKASDLADSISSAT